MKFWLPHLIFAVVLSSTIWFYSQSHRPVERLESVRYANLRGELQSLEQWRGRWLLINFWATWCQPCRTEIPYFNRRFAQTDPQRLAILGFAVDSPENVSQFMQTTAIDYPQWVDERGIDLAFKLGNQRQGLPFTVLVNPQGKIVARHLGALSEADLDRLLAKLPSAKG
ncbi:TlpA disulfide reductase family protein [Methylomonas sp. EFPC3]|uniref:TlpA family protein disulfide reductase n=1 Tax=Methylomonas sp. EFPC3 TaxID=3021710 RepID=UPI002416CEEA|nr:TlpA disulfide reductase family protein [Methylomonas sp. EFPC3]WFP52127.1 TlpA disulfide reductase family protein [Methylomonas sp. EFPC3]